MRIRSPPFGIVGLSKLKMLVVNLHWLEFNIGKQNRWRRRYYRLFFNWNLLSNYNRMQLNEHL